MKYSLSLGVMLFANWLLWSGYFGNAFLVTLGFLACVFCVWLSRRMRIVDDEGVPVDLGIRPFTRYAPWLAKQIVLSNWAVAKIILSRKMPLQRQVLELTAEQRTPLGRVMLANSITLTPGTVSVCMHGNQITVHALSFDGAEEELSRDMGRRIQELEGDR